jgi:hypothetical protein
MSKDFNIEAAEQQAAYIDAAIKQQIADLAAYRGAHDVDGAATVVQTIADLEASKRNLTQLCQDYIESQQPRQEVLTEEERIAKPWNRMTAEDGLAVARQSKYGKNLDWNDAHVRAGWQEAQRRRHRGE